MNVPTRNQFEQGARPGGPKKGKKRPSADERRNQKAEVRKQTGRALGRESHKPETMHVGSVKRSDWTEGSGESGAGRQGGKESRKET